MNYTMQDSTFKYWGTYKLIKFVPVIPRKYRNKIAERYLNIEAMIRKGHVTCSDDTYDRVADLACAMATK